MVTVTIPLESMADPCMDWGMRFVKQKTDEHEADQYADSVRL
jgi:hypothetical protein